MKKVGIYKITNIVNNKCYIGSSRNIMKRISEHKRRLRKKNHHSIKLQRSWDVYGEENFIFEIICECEINQLISLEQKYFDEINPELIILKVAGSFEGYRHTEKTKQLLREKRLKQTFIMTDEWKKNISLSKKGTIFSEEHKLKLSKAHIGKKHSEEQKEKRRNACDRERMIEMQKLTVLKRKENNSYRMTNTQKQKIGESNQVPVIAVDINNNIIHLFSSYKEASLFLKRTELTLWRYIKSGKNINGLIWKRKEDYVQ